MEAEKGNRYGHRDAAMMGARCSPLACLPMHSLILFSPATGEFTAMKSAQAVLREIVEYVRPPAECAIVLTEWDFGPAKRNWVAACGYMEEEKLRRFNEKDLELRKSDPTIDWSSETIGESGRRRVVHAARASG